MGLQPDLGLPAGPGALGQSLFRQGREGLRWTCLALCAVDCFHSEWDARSKLGHPSSQLVPSSQQNLRLGV